MITRNNKSEQYFELFSTVDFILHLVASLSLDWMHIMPASTMKNELDRTMTAVLNLEASIVDYVRNNADKFAAREGKEAVDFWFDNYWLICPSKESAAKKYKIGFEYAKKFYEEHKDGTFNPCVNKEASEDEER